MPTPLWSSRTLRASRKNKTICLSGVPVKLAAAAGGQSLRRFAIVAYTGGLMQPSGYDCDVVVDLAGLVIEKQSRPILFDHDSTRIVGHTERITIEGNQILAEGIVSGASPEAEQVCQSSDKGFPWQASIGASVGDEQYIPAGQSVTVNGQTFEGPLRVIRAAVLSEISFVSLGADDNTSALIAARKARLRANGKTNMKTYEEWLAEMGFDAATLSETQSAALRKAYDAEYPAEVAAEDGEDEEDTVEAEDGEDEEDKVEAKKGKAKTTAKPPVKTIRATAPARVNRMSPVDAMRREMLRCMQIDEVCKAHPQIGMKAKAEGWTKDRAELEVLRASRSTVRSATTTKEQSANVLHAALAMAAKVPGHEKQFDDRTLQAAHSQFKSRIGIKQFLLECAWKGGYDGRHFDQSQDGMRTILRAAFSAAEISGILSNIANKSILAGYNNVEQTWRKISSIRPVNDFKTITSYRLIGDMKFAPLGPGGELKHGDLGEQSYTNRAKTYGKILVITREMIINDDMGALNDIPRALGRGAGLKLNDIFWTAFCANTSFFTAGTGSFDDGTDSALSVDGLTSAELLFLNQTDPEGNPLGVMPKTLLVPNALKVTADQLMKSVEVLNTTASTEYPTANPHAGKFAVETSSYLANASYGNSAVKWYLLADPADVPVIETCFLNGQESPTIENADADFDQLGVQMRGYFDFGVTLQDYRGGVAMKGEA